LYERILDEIKKASSLVISSIKERKLDIKKLEKEFQKAKNIEERNSIIYRANQKGFSQHKLATIVGVSQTQINRIIKKQRV